jgi:hypothetical protein
VITGFGSEEFDAEGRWVEARFDTARRKLSIISCYFPSGSSGEERQAGQVPLPGADVPAPDALKAEREFILVGDVNIAHQEIDLKNWRSNQKNSGFLPEERAWMTRLLTEGGLVDVFRTLNPTPRAVHMVEQPRPGLGQERGLAAGLPPGHAGAGGQGQARVTSTWTSASRPRAADHRLRLQAQGRLDAHRRLPVGMLGANGVVAPASRSPPARRMRMKLAGDRHIVACFFGDGAANRGPFLEGLELGQGLRSCRCSSCARTTASRPPPGPRR